MFSEPTPTLAQELEQSGDHGQTARFFYEAVLIRRFEERVLELFSERLVFGTTHCYIGQEANAIGVIAHLTSDDVVWSNHRCHGHYLVFTGDVDGLMAELMGRATGTVGGRGGSQHLCHGNFFSNGVQGGIMPAAAGMAFVEKRRQAGCIVTVFIGDGTLGEGLTYETLNIASLWKLPLLVVVENNRYSQSTPIERHLAGDIGRRFEAFGIPAVRIASFDAEEIHHASAPVLDAVRREGTPRALVLDTYRFCSHSKSDDGRAPEEIARWLPYDPVEILRRRLDPAAGGRLEEMAVGRVRSAEMTAREAPWPVLDGPDSAPTAR